MVERAQRNPKIDISIHASRMGCDRHVTASRHVRKYFNPRIPYGMRQAMRDAAADHVLFQSTHPVWDATPHTRSKVHVIYDFNPRIPYGMRRRGEGGA